MNNYVSFIQLIFYSISFSSSLLINTTTNSPPFSHNNYSIHNQFLYFILSFLVFSPSFYLSRTNNRMGICTSTEYSVKGGNQSWQSTVNIVNMDGRLEQLQEPIKAWHVLSQNPNCYICCSETMYVGSPMLPVPPTQDLHLGLIYFLVPLSKYRVPLSLQDLGALAIKANAALAAAATPNYPILEANQQKEFRTHPTLSNVSLGCSH